MASSSPASSAKDAAAAAATALIASAIAAAPSGCSFDVDEKVLVAYGPLLYDAKVRQADASAEGEATYLVH